MYNEKPLLDNSNLYLIKEHEYVRKHKLSNMHYHSEFELIYVKKGCINFYINGEEYSVKEGNVIFINSNIIHCTECTQNNTVNILLQFKNPGDSGYSLRYLSGFIKKIKVPYFVFDTNTPDTAVLINFMEEVLLENKLKGNAYKNFISGYLYLIIALMQRKKILPDDREILRRDEIHKFNPLFEYVDKYYHEQISLDDLSKLMHLNQAYLCRIFKDATGGTITEYINYVRIHKAIKMLKTNKTLSEIAYQCGFSSLTYFNRVFKKSRNYSASEYRKLSHSEVETD